MTANTAQDVLTPLYADDITVLTPEDLAWPTGLDQLPPDEHPSALWVRGDPAPLTEDSPRIAVVGSRAASAYGTTVASSLAADLARAGHVIVTEADSAIGAAALRGVLGVHQRAIVVLACGIERPMNEQTSTLVSAVAASGGTVVSACPSHALPSRAAALQRARLLAALGEATVVVEAGLRSRALDTAYEALRLGRRVAAVPGPTTSANSAGCHRLIQQGETHLITQAQDLTDVIANRISETQSTAGPDRSHRAPDPAFPCPHPAAPASRPKCPPAAPPYPRALDRSRARSPAFSTDTLLAPRTLRAAYQLQVYWFRSCAGAYALSAPVVDGR